MRVIPAVLLLIAAGCERYTEATSPCFGANGAPVVGRSAIAPLAFVAETHGPEDCIFEPIGSGR